MTKRDRDRQSGSVMNGGGYSRYFRWMVIGSSH